MQQVVSMEMRETQIIVLCPSSPEGSLAAGTTKAAQYEFPELTCQRIFLPPNLLPDQPCDAPCKLSEEVPTWVDSVLSVVKSGGTTDSDYWLQMHGRRRVAVFVPRMKPLVSLPGSDIVPLGQRRAQESFIVTGGTGGIGTALVNWLIGEQGVDPSRVVLLSRKAFDHPLGATVVKVDLTDSDSMLQCPSLSAIRSVGGVFHLAGTLHDGILTSVTPDKMEHMFRPKVQGAKSLLRLIRERDWDPEFFLNFSSTSSLLGYPGQSAYCAANSFLDAIPAWGLREDSDDTSVTTINWGPWAEAGMTVNSPKALEMSIEGGDIPLSNEDAFGVLARIISGRIEARRVAVCNVQWNKSIWRESQLLAELELPTAGEDAAPPTSHGVQATVARTDEASTSSSPAVGGEIEKLLRSHLSGWHLDESLADLGLDSLDLVRLRGTFQKQFQKSIPMPVFMKPQTLRDLQVELQLVLSSNTSRRLTL
jgi:NADP-dependent 3-hydroxy acid dehydrogenase YdfG/acyl carrier protein